MDVTMLLAVVQAAAGVLSAGVDLEGLIGRWWRRRESKPPTLKQAVEDHLAAAGGASGNGAGSRVIVPAPIVEAATRKIKECLLRYAGAYDLSKQLGGNVFDVHNERSRLAAEICAELRMVKRMNRNDLPPEMGDFWTNFCEAP